MPEGVRGERGREKGERERERRERGERERERRCQRKQKQGRKDIQKIKGKRQKDNKQAKKKKEKKEGRRTREGKQMIRNGILNCQRKKVGEKELKGRLRGVVDDDGEELPKREWGGVEGLRGEMGRD